MKQQFLIFTIFIFSFSIPCLSQIQKEDSINLTEEIKQMETIDENEAEDHGLYFQLKTKFIEGNPYFMSVISAILILGLAFSIERIIYLNLADVNSKKLLRKVEEALEKRDVEAAKNIVRNTRGPVASIIYQGLMRIDQDIDVIENSIVSYGSVQSGLLERNFTWISLFIAMAPTLGFLGTVWGMIQAFDAIEVAADITPSIIAGGMKVALITTVGGLIVALILQVFYNYILTKDESIIHKMEDTSVSLLDIILKYKEKAV